MFLAQVHNTVLQVSLKLSDPSIPSLPLYHWATAHSFLKMLTAFYLCCIYSDTLQNIETMKANIMNNDQTAP